MDTEQCDSCEPYWRVEGEEPPCKGCIYALAGCKVKDRNQKNTNQ